MKEEFIITRLKRIFDQCVRAQEKENEQNVGKVIVSEFNELLDELQDSYPDNPIVQDVDPVGLTGIRNRPHPQDIEQVRMNVYSVADSLGIEMENFSESAERSGDLTIVNVTQQQAAQQQVSVENLIEQINTMMISPDDQEELKEIVREFEHEIENDPDSGVLKRLFSDAKDFSRDVALKLAMKALENGIDIVS